MRRFSACQYLGQVSLDSPASDFPPEGRQEDRYCQFPPGGDTGRADASQAVGRAEALSARVSTIANDLSAEQLAALRRRQPANYANFFNII